MNTQNRQKIQIAALDTVFFRDGKPFTGGEDDWVDTLFPPSPSVIYGALRGKYFVEMLRTFEAANTPTDPTLNLKITTVALQHEHTLLFPLPLDCVKEKGDTTRKAFVLKRGNVPISNCPVKSILMLEHDVIVENVENGLLDNLSLADYLNGQTAEIYYAKLEDYMVSEPKLGIGRENHAHVSQEGMLYRIDMRRLESKMKFGYDTTQSISLFVEFEGLSIPNSGLIKLGGEGKAVHYTLSTVCLPEKPQLTGNQFKLYLATPAIFNQGWLPCWIDPYTLIGRYGKFELRLITAIIGKPVVVGGFNMKEKAPKVMKKAVPSGSVYYFEIVNNGTIQEAVDIFHTYTISDEDADAFQGFGMTFVGGVL